MQVGFGGLLALIFITLKLTDYIDWSWWWVLAPIWVPVLIALGLASLIIFRGGSVRVKHKK